MYVFLLVLSALALVAAPTWAVPPSQVNGTPVAGPRARAVAVAESCDLRDGRVAVLESVDVYNDDLRGPLLILGVFADTWLGHHREGDTDPWLPAAERIYIAPGACERVVSRQRIVGGRAGRCWYVRWIRFKIATDHGDILSNMAASPVRMPGVLDDDRSARELPPWAGPDDLSPAERATSAVTIDRSNQGGSGRQGKADSK